MADGDVAVVTGGAGFLGQHIVNMLQEKTSVKEIRVFDVREYYNNIGHEERLPVKSIIGDLRETSDLEAAFEGADVVFHAASIVCVAAFPDYKHMEAINVQGTANVISACVKADVHRLVYTSTIDVMVDKTWNSHTNMTEAEPYPESHIYEGYAGTKFCAEKLVLEANGKQLKGDGYLRTVSIRALPIYGEQDVNFVIKFLQTADLTLGTFIPFSRMGVHPFAYVGNTAWGHVLAGQVMKDDPKIGGEAFIITDESPKVSCVEFAKPFLNARGFTVSKYYVPFAFLYVVVCLIQLFCLLFQPLMRIGPSVFTRSSLIHLQKNITFNGKKAREMLGYRPLYDYKESLDKCMPYYERAPL